MTMGDKLHSSVGLSEIGFKTHRKGAVYFGRPMRNVAPGQEKTDQR